MCVCVSVHVYETDRSSNDRNRSCSAEGTAKGRGKDGSTSPLCSVTVLEGHDHVGPLGRLDKTLMRRVTHTAYVRLCVDNTAP